MPQTVAVVLACQPHFTSSKVLLMLCLIRFVRGEGLNKFCVEMYLAIFRKLPNYIFRLTPHNLQKSLAFSSWVFRLTGFVGIIRHACNNNKV